MILTYKKVRCPAHIGFVSARIVSDGGSLVLPPGWAVPTIQRTCSGSPWSSIGRRRPGNSAETTAHSIAPRHRVTPARQASFIHSLHAGSTTRSPAQRGTTWITVCGTGSAAVSPSANPMAKPPSGTRPVRSRPRTSVDGGGPQNPRSTSKMRSERPAQASHAGGCRSSKRVISDLVLIPAAASAGALHQRDSGCPAMWTATAKPAHHNRRLSSGRESERFFLTERRCTASASPARPRA